MLIQELLNIAPQSKLSEDWGSSDWYAALSYMARDIKAGATEEEAAESAAEFYHDHMGYDDVQDAADRILDRWKSLPKERKEKFLSNLREGIDRYEDPETGDWWDDDGNHGNTKTGEQYHMGKRVMPNGAARYRARTSGVSKPAAEKIYHKVPFAKKDDAKAEGMKWDPEKKMWYHTSKYVSASSKFPKA